MHLELVRFAYLDTCTLGRLFVRDEDALEDVGVPFVTIERPWIQNPKGPGGMPRESCVPDGTYAVRPHSSDRFPDTYALVQPVEGVFYQPGDVPPGLPYGRTAILIHAGNTVADVIGCIAIGKMFLKGTPAPAIGQSRAALGELRSLLGRTGQHELWIRAIRGTAEA